MSTQRYVILIGLLIVLGSPNSLAQRATVLEVENIVQAAIGGGDWTPATKGQSLAVKDRLRTRQRSRATVRLTDLYTLRLDQFTTIEIAPALLAEKPQLDLLLGTTFILSREPAGTIDIKTPAANAASRGTQLIVSVTPFRKTILAVLEGEVELKNAQGNVLLKSGEQGEAEIGKAPRKTAAIEAVNILQWALYYPGVLNLPELGLTFAEERAVSASLAAYREGDLLGALEKYPAGHRAGSSGGRLYRAAVLLAVGRVDEAHASLASVPREAPGRRALEQVIAAVKFEDWSRTGEPATASEWLAESYYQQSKSHLESALKAARNATELAPDFGYAWVRLAELEFSFGHTRAALRALGAGLKLTPRNAQAHALRGFLLSAQNSIGAARQAFQNAIDLDGALGNGWLGRGLTYIRQGKDELGRLDLQTAATVEPNRSIFHSYLGKAFSQVGDSASARKEFQHAKELDRIAVARGKQARGAQELERFSIEDYADPTPWLYSAILDKQENRYNEAIASLEKSIGLNDNRRVYRSQFLLDQDRAIRGTNLAAIYENNGMIEQSVREAVRAVGNDYSSSPAHLFLANSYNALRDPSRILLRYETAWFNELLLSHLLSPVGGGPLSQYVSEQEYSKLFEADGLGISSVTEYFTDGELRETGSQYGTFGNISYALDAEYQYNNGRRPNNEISRLEAYATFKLQLGPQDTLFFQTKFQELETGDLFQNYDNDAIGRKTTLVADANGKLRKVPANNVSRQTFDFRERQDPGLLLAGWHHEWNPGNHTILLLGRLANDQVLTADDTSQTILSRDITRPFPEGLVIDPPEGERRLSDADLRGALYRRAGSGNIRRVNASLFDFDYRANFETYSGELSQILTLGPTTLILGGRYQRGQFDTQVRLDDLDNGNARGETGADQFFKNPPARQAAVVDFERINLYFYDVWRLSPWLSVTGGVTYDSLRYPENFRSPPVNEVQRSFDKVSPKAGLTLTPWRGAVIRGAYAQAVSGPSFDESIRLEPTQVNGFLQAYRTVISESEIGSVGGSEYQFWGLSLEQKIAPTRTYLGVEYNVLQQDLDRTIGVFDALFVDSFLRGIVPSSLAEKDSYREDAITATVNQLVGDHWAFGTRYRYTHSKFRQQFAGFEDGIDRIQETGDPFQERENLPSLARNAERNREAGLHQINLYAVFNHPSGFFARAEANWYRQDNDDFVTSVVFPPQGAPPDSRPRLRTDNLGLPGDDFWHFNVFAGWRFYRNQCELSCGLLNITGADYQLDPLNPYLELPRDRTFMVRAKFSF